VCSASGYLRGDSEKPTGPKWRKPRSDFHPPHSSVEHAGYEATNEQTCERQSCSQTKHRLNPSEGKNVRWYCNERREATLPRFVVGIVVEIVVETKAITRFDRWPVSAMVIYASVPAFAQAQALLETEESVLGRVIRLSRAYQGR
jgi:hypothetical protein